MTKYKAPFLLIGCLLVQIALQLISIKTGKTYLYILEATFLGVAVAIYMNRQIKGTKWILLGSLLNFLAISIHGGLMPVSEKALRIAGLTSLIDVTDSRHQTMQSSLFGWLGDWIPFITPVGHNYVLSPGDVFVGIGIIILIVGNSVRMGGTTGERG